MNNHSQGRESTQLSSVPGNIIELSIVMPCLNESETVGVCVKKAVDALRKENVRGEVIVADNGSTDGSQEIATELGAKVVDVERRGYGAALLAGFQAAQGKYIIMGDSDNSYDFGDIAPFLHQLRNGADVVMGSRLNGTILPGAMPWLHRWIGNPVLTAVANLLFHANISDYHCGMRGFDREAVCALHLQTPGMEFASEFVVKALLNGLKISEVPITYYPDGRSRKSHLRTWPDGWRHLKFLLMLSPLWVFIVPGLIFLLVGTILLLSWLFQQPVLIDALDPLPYGRPFSGAIAAIVGLQLVIIGVLSRLFAIKVGLLPGTKLWVRLQKHLRVDTGLLLSLVLAAVSAVLLFRAYQINSVERLLFGILFVAVSMQVLSTSFAISLISLTDSFD